MDEYQTLKKVDATICASFSTCFIFTLVKSLGVINDISNYESVTLAPPTQAKYAPVRIMRLLFKLAGGIYWPRPFCWFFIWDYIFFRHEVPIFGR